MAFAELLVEAMTDRGLTNLDLGNAVYTRFGIRMKESEVSRYRNGQLLPLPKRLSAICDVLNLDLRTTAKMVRRESVISRKLGKLVEYLLEDLPIFSTKTGETVNTGHGKSDRGGRGLRPRKIAPENGRVIDAILGFDHGMYPTPFPVTKQLLTSWVERTNTYCLHISHGGRLLGYCVSVPVSDEVFDQLLRGQMKECDLIADCIDVGARNLYIYSLMGADAFCAGLVLTSLVLRVNEHKIRRLGGLVVTPQAESICKNLGFTPIWADSTIPTNPPPTSYVASVGGGLPLDSILKAYRRLVEAMSLHVSNDSTKD